MKKKDYTIYFSDPTVTEIYITEDNQVFYPSAKSFLTFHCKEKNVKFATVTRTEAFKSVKTSNEPDPNVEEKSNAGKDPNVEEKSKIKEKETSISIPKDAVKITEKKK